MRQVISFDRVKLTNNEMDDKGHVGNPSEHARPFLNSVSVHPFPMIGFFSNPQIVFKCCFLYSICLHSKGAGGSTADKVCTLCNAPQSGNPEGLCLLGKKEGDVRL